MAVVDITASPSEFDEVEEVVELGEGVDDWAIASEDEEPSCVAGADEDEGES